MHDIVIYGCVQIVVVVVVTVVVVVIRSRQLILKKLLNPDLRIN